MNKKKQIILLIGPPGSGKGTQAKILAKKLNLEYLGSGDCLRERQKKQDFTGKKLIQVMNKGMLVPSFVIIKILGDKLEQARENNNKNGFVLDGWNRIIYEAILIDEALEWYEWQKSAKIVLIKISARESFNRLTKRRQCKKCGKIIPWIGKFKKLTMCDSCGGELITRSDDKIEVIKKRIEEYKRETLPSIRYYRKQKRLIEINGEQPIEKVAEDILKAIK